MGLKLGKHSFEYEINDAFFEVRDYSPITSGDLKVNLILEKKETMMIAEFTAHGFVKVLCDRCNTPMDLLVDSALRIIYKTGTEESEDETLVVIPPEAYQIDVSDPIYEMIMVGIPARPIHKEGQCDAEMLETMKQYVVNSDDEEYDDESDEEDDYIDPRWEILRNKN